MGYVINFSKLWFWFDADVGAYLEYRCLSPAIQLGARKLAAKWLTASGLVVLVVVVYPRSFSVNPSCCFTLTSLLRLQPQRKRERSRNVLFRMEGASELRFAIQSYKRNCALQKLQPIEHHLNTLILE